MAIPAFREDGYLPEGLHRATEEEMLARFAQASPRREYLAGRLQRWLALARALGAKRFFVDGSFVTSKPEPGDVDAVVWLAESLREQILAHNPAAAELDTMLRSREPEELFAAHSQEAWDAWVAFFQRTREPDRRRKGVVEVLL